MWAVRELWGRKREDWCGGGGRRVASEKDWRDGDGMPRGGEIF